MTINKTTLLTMIEIIIIVIVSAIIIGVVVYSYSKRISELKASF